MASLFEHSSPDLIRPADSDVERAAQVLVSAFAEDMLWVRLFPDRASREVKMGHLYVLMLRYGIRKAEVYATSAGFEGVAVWFSGDLAGIALSDVVSPGGIAVPFAVGLPGLLRLSAFGRHAQELRQRLAPFPHHHLVLLGVAPEHQGRGHARRLLEPVLARLDRERIPCYLETQNERNVAFYERFGFALKERAEYTPLSLPTWCMIRAVAVPQSRD